MTPALVYHVLAGEDLLDSLRRCQDGEAADAVYAELWANAEHEQVAPKPTRDEQKDMARALLAPHPDPDDDTEYVRGLRDAVNALLYREHPNGIEEEPRD